MECDPRCRDEDYDVVAELIADIRSAYGDVPLYRHSDWIQTTCCGSYDINRLDQLSYTKFSAPVAWGQGGDKNPKQPTPAPVVVPIPVPPTPETVDPSPTTLKSDGQPQVGSGLPVTEKPDYVAPKDNWLVLLIKLIMSIFKK